MQHTFQILYGIKVMNIYYVLQNSLTVSLLISVTGTLCDILLIVFFGRDNSLYQYIRHKVAYQYTERFDRSSSRSIFMFGGIKK